MKEEKLLMTNEARKWLADHGYDRTSQWVRMMVKAGKIKTTKREGRNFYSISELKKVISEKRGLKVSISAIVLFLLISATAFATAPISTPEINRIVDAIYVIEGGQNAVRPFGIMSVKCEGYSDCRQIAFNTVRNNHRRWIDAGEPGDFLEYLRNKYAPIDAENDPRGMNKNWLPNLRSRLWIR